ncbi:MULTISPECIES: hypothetical protein [unclassified Nocardia]|uniref:Rv1733c family protein n=1 Tax=unclassified Nocardia TaxID=2637762 RepID=UPI00278BE815|nr:MULTISPECIES: hypothetical protein [unclassified Nocardia]
MSGYPSLSVRLWRMRPWNASPLMPASLRFETVAIATLLALCLLVVPIAGAVGTEAYSRTNTRILSDNATKTLVTATITDDPTHQKSERRFLASVSWNDDGHEHTRTAPVPYDTGRGDEVPVWIGADGTPVDPPLRTGDALLDGIGAGMVALFSVWSTAGLLIWATRAAIDHRRDTAWTVAWHRLNHPTRQ